MELKEIKELARLMKENDLTALELTEKGTALRLERKGGGEAAPAARFAPASAEASAGDGPAPAQKEPGILVRSPTVGVFYTSASPESEPFVKVGDRVKPGDTLCIIEAMKLMNEIPAELEGTVAEVCAVNGQVVEYDQALFRIV